MLTPSIMSWRHDAGPLGLEEVVAIARDVLDGLTQLHALHILHLDPKPGNLLDDCDHAYLSDFGISHALRTLEACTAVTSSLGTPHYMYVHSLLPLRYLFQSQIVYGSFCLKSASQRGLPCIVACIYGQHTH